ncbi:hypothetical protein BOX15_Mlig019725g2, partial [Macrostomum lignano]
GKSGASSGYMCSLPDELQQKLKKFRLRKEKNVAAIVLKIDREKMEVCVETEVQDCSIEDIVEELSEHQPRYLLLSYVHSYPDGRVTYPLMFIFSTPRDSNPELQVLYTGTIKTVIDVVGLTKVFEIRSTDELDEEWLQQKLEFYR